MTTRVVRGAARRVDGQRRRLALAGTHAAAGVHRTVAGAAVALTFDDGPDPVFTPRILDVLADLDVRATFFVVGDAAREHPEIVRRMVDDGHAVGSHTTSHPDLWELSLAGIRREIERGHRTVEAAAGRRTTLFRPPKGHLDVRVATAARLANLRPWLWTIDPEDWVPGVLADEIVDAVQPSAGDVVLLHDGLRAPLDDAALDRSSTVIALPHLVAGIRARGLDLVPLPEGQVRR